MKLFKNLLRSAPTPSEPEDILGLFRVIEPRLEKASLDIFLRYRDHLLEMPITYIVPAVWGAAKDGGLTAAQRAMHQEIRPVIQGVMETLHLGSVSAAQQFAVEALVRGFIITKVTYLIEAFKNRLSRQSEFDCAKNNPLYDLEPAGHA